MSAELVADRGSPSRRRRFLTFAVVAAAILVIGYGAAGAYAYEQESAVQPHCLASSYGNQTPANFDVIDDVASRASTVDAGPYRFSDFRPVEFPARGSKVTIRGWYA